MSVWKHTATTYNDYYRFNNYSVSGGTVNGNVLTPTENCTVKANFKLNSFVASGGFERGSDITIRQRSPKAVGPFYCTRSYSTSNVPSSWYSTSNRWKPLDNSISGYSMVVNGIMTFSGKNSNQDSNGAYTACILGGSTKYNVGTGSIGRNQRVSYKKTSTLTTTNVNYGVSGQFKSGYYSPDGATIQARYIAAGTSGTWKATGVIK